MGDKSLKKTISEIMLTMLLTVMLSLAFKIGPAKASGTIYIRADGSIEPLGAPVFTADNVTYTFVDNIFDLIVVERDNIVIDGHGYTVQGPQTGTGIDLSGRENVTVWNTQITAFNSGIWLDSSANYNTISGNNITANYWYGIRLGHSSNTNRIYRNNITRNGIGIEISNSANNSVSENYILSNTNYGVGIFESSNNQVSRNNITANGVHGIILSAYSYDNSVNGNVIEENSDTGIELWAWTHNNEITENVFINDGLRVANSYGNIVQNNSVNGKPLLYFEGISDLTIADSGMEVGQIIIVSCKRMFIRNLTVSETEIGIQLFNTTDTKLINNTLSSNLESASGIELWSSFNDTIAGNSITSGYFGIGFWDSRNNEIIRNRISGGGRDGIWFDNSSSNYILYNEVTGNLAMGIALQNSPNNIIRGNNISSNGNDGISLWFHSVGNRIFENNITANRMYGVWAGSNDNFVYHNNFVNNTNQVGIYVPSTNNWDNGFEGNYWSDYKGIDSNGDGIGDTPYIIDGDNVDHYPLINPYWNPSDINHDLKVNLQDVLKTALAFGSYPGHPKWNPHCDTDGNFRIDLKDIYIICKSFGKKY
jgi:parallel beta-helix repeat protein